MVTQLDTITGETSENVRGGEGSVISHQLLSEQDGSYLKNVGIVRVAPGASVGLHEHDGDEDFYYCLSGTGVVTDNGKEHPFQQGTFQITRSGGSQGVRNTGTTELIFIGVLLKTPKA